MSRDWTPDELQAASAAMKAAGHMRYEILRRTEKTRREYKTYEKALSGNRKNIHKP